MSIHQSKRRHVCSLTLTAQRESQSRQEIGEGGKPIEHDVIKVTCSLRWPSAQGGKQTLYTMEWHVVGSYA